MNIDKPSFRLPNETHRTLIVGRTGSGKTRLGSFLLSRAPFDKQPYVVLDYKREELFTRTKRIREIGFKDIPKQPGLYIMRLLPGDEEAVEAWLWKVWDHEKVGLYVDEGYSISQRSKALQAVLTQGRSKRLPVYYLSQRPSWISQFVFSEADFYYIFPLNKLTDRQRVQEMVPGDRLNVADRLPPFWSYHYDVAQDMVAKMAPVPDDEEILDYMDRRLTPKRKVS